MKLGTSTIGTTAAMTSATMTSTIIRCTAHCCSTQLRPAHSAHHEPVSLGGRSFSSGMHCAKAQGLQPPKSGTGN